MQKSYSSQSVAAALTKAMLEFSPETLSLIALCTGKAIGTGTAPFIGRYLKVGDQLVTDRTPKCDKLEISYLWCEEGPDTGRLMRIGIGTEIHGPLLAWVNGQGWTNLYGDGAHSADTTADVSAKGYFVSAGPQTTLMNAITARNYMVGEEYQESNAFIEGPALITALQQLAIQE